MASSTQTFIASDRGCLPTIVTTGTLATAATGATQTTTTPYTLGTLAGTTLGSALIDLNTLTANLCNNYGTCCYTTLCNGSNKFKLNPVGLVVFAFASVLSTTQFVF